MWDKERKGRVENAHALSDEKRIHNDLQWQLREAEQRLSAQQGAHHDLQLEYEKAKHETEKAVEAVKQVKREKRELQMKITLLTEDIRRYELDASKARFEVASSVDQVQVLRREHLADADKASDFQNRELAFALDRLKDSEKRNKELQHTFGIERDRYEARQKGISFERTFTTHFVYVALPDLVDQDFCAPHLSFTALPCDNSIFTLSFIICSPLRSLGWKG